MKMFFAALLFVGAYSIILILIDDVMNKKEKQKRYSVLLNKFDENYFDYIEDSFNKWFQNCLQSSNLSFEEDKTSYFVFMKELPFDYNDHDPYFYLKVKYGITIMLPNTKKETDIHVTINIEKNKLGEFKQLLTEKESVKNQLENVQFMTEGL